jgi:hypothetical protein
MRLFIILWVILAGQVAAGCAGQESGAASEDQLRAERAKFRGLDGIRMSVLLVTGEDKHEFIQERDLAPIILARFQANGVKYIHPAHTFRDGSKEEATEAVADLKKLKLALLNVHFRLTKTAEGQFVYSLNFEVVENATLVRNRSVRVLGTLYRVEKFGLSNLPGIKDAMKRAVEEGVDSLCEVFARATAKSS